MARQRVNLQHLFHEVDDNSVRMPVYGGELPENYDFTRTYTATAVGTGSLQRNTGKRISASAVGTSVLTYATVIGHFSFVTCTAVATGTASVTKNVGFHLQATAVGVANLIAVLFGVKRKHVVASIRAAERIVKKIRTRN